MRPNKFITALCVALVGILPIALWSISQRASADSINFSDTFTEGGFSFIALPSHTPTTGTSWTKIISNDTAGDQIGVNAVNDQLELGTGGCSLNEGAGYTANATYSGADYAVQVRQKNGGNTVSYDWIGVRIQDASNGYWLRFNEDANTAQIYKVVAGAWSAIGSAGSTTIVDESIVKFEVIGSTLKAYDDGVEILSTTDTSHSSAGKAGIGMGDLTNNGSDDCVNQSLDDFQVTIIESAAPAASIPSPKVISIL